MKQRSRGKYRRQGGGETYHTRPSLARPSRRLHPVVRRSFAVEEAKKLTELVCRSLVDATIVNAVVLIVAVVAAGQS